MSSATRSLLPSAPTTPKHPVLPLPYDGRFPFIFDNGSDPPETPGWLDWVEHLASSLRDHGGSIVIRDWSKYVRHEYTPGDDPSVRHTRQFHLSGPLGLQGAYEYDETGAADWRRICYLEGLSAIHRHYPLDENVTRLFGEDHPFGLLDSFKLHLGCAQLAKISLAEYRNKRAGSRDRFLLDCTYQYSCFRLRSRKQASNMSFVDCAWGAGSLYGDADKILEQQTWTICGRREHFEGQWSIVVFTPPRWYYRVFEAEMPRVLPPRRQGLLLRLPHAEKGGPVKQANLQDAMFNETYTALRIFVNDWTELSEHCEYLLGTGGAILDPELLDQLLFDTENFDRSRKYFWIINAADEFLRVLTQTLRVFKQFVDQVISYPADSHSKRGLELPPEQKEYSAEIETGLKSLIEQFTNQRTRAEALRDGLFSASAVAESRAATQLGENVKLLTYVSIFYLPLGFITSLWSIPGTSLHPNQLIYTIIPVAVLTYFVVFNLNTFVNFGRRRYQGLKRGLVQRMKEDDNAQWKHRGERYNRFRPVPTSDLPSEWFLLWYWPRSVQSWIRAEVHKLKVRWGEGRRKHGAPQGATTP